MRILALLLLAGCATTPLRPLTCKTVDGELWWRDSIGMYQHTDPEVPAGAVCVTLETVDGGCE